MLVTGLGMWSTVVWSARMILSESALNFSLVIVMGALLCEVFVVVCASFRSLLNEFDSLFYFLEVVLFATVPLLNTAIVTWFLCVEVPSLDFPLCFSTVYFLYVSWLARPRRASHPAAAGNPRVGPVGEPMLALPRNVLMLVYAMPVVLSFTLHAAVHHNVLLEHSWTRAAGLLISALSPLMYDAALLRLSRSPFAPASLFSRPRPPHHLYPLTALHTFEQVHVHMCGSAAGVLAREGASGGGARDGSRQAGGVHHRVPLHAEPSHDAGLEGFFRPA